MLRLQEVVIFLSKGKNMVLAIPSIGGLILLLLVAYLFLGAPVGNTRSLIITIINVLLLVVVVYFILSLFGVIA